MCSPSPPLLREVRVGVGGGVMEPTAGRLQRDASKTRGEGGGLTRPRAPPLPAGAVVRPTLPR